jgi:RNA-directed DNA polymerase
MNVGEMQRKLSQWAERDKRHRFFDLYHLIYDKDWLRLAHDYVKQNAGSKTAGCDGIQMSVFDEQLEENLQQLAEELRRETFEPHPVRRVHIPKANGKTRPLGIASIRDRIVQEALRMIMEPIYEADFYQRSFGFRPNRRTMDAIKYADLNTIGTQRYFWFIECDISSYFDTVHHRKLMQLLQGRLKDRKMLDLIWKFLRAGVMERGLFHQTERGVPQGGIASPLLANIYLHEFDKFLEQFAGIPQYQKHRRRIRGEANFTYARYADDVLVLCNGTKRQAEVFKEGLSKFLSEELYLTLSPEKTKITHLNDGVRFLGYELKRCRTSKGMITKWIIPSDAIDRLREKIMQATNPSSHRDSLEYKILGLNRFVGGWCRYYQYANATSRPFSRIGHLLYWRMAHWLARKYQTTIPQALQQYERNNTFHSKCNRLLMPQTDFPTKLYRKALFKPNPYTMQEAKIEREELPNDSYWTGYEKRPGMADLRLLVIEKDGSQCQICGIAVDDSTAQVDHLKPIRRFKRPIDANTPENLWTLCAKCHMEKTQFDRQMESPLR